MLGSLILYLKGMRIMMFQLSGFYCRVAGSELDCGFFRMDRVYVVNPLCSGLVKPCST